jgi:hypothetical protein
MTSLAWGGFYNGRIAQSALARCVNYHPLTGEPVGTSGGFLMAAAARQWLVMDAHYFATFNRHLSLSEGYRDIVSQNVRYAIYRAGGNLAAYPGTSNHGWGRSVDIGPEGREWVKANGPAFGFHATVPSESWHFDYLGSPSITLTPAEAKAQRPTPAILKKDVNQMYVIRDASSKAVYTVGPQQVRYNETAASASAAIKVFGPRVELTKAETEQVFQALGVPTRYAGEGFRLLKSEGGFWSRADDNSGKVVNVINQLKS